VEQVQAQTKVRLAAGGEHGQGCIQAVAEGGIRLKLQGQADLEGIGPLGSTQQLVAEMGPVGPLPGSRQVHGDNHQGNIQGLAQFQAATEMFPMAPTRGFIPEKKSTLTGRCHQADTAVVDQLPGLGQCVPLQMLFQFGQPDFQSGASQGSGLFDVLSEGLGERGQLRQAR
jgi:hypothetical protein